MSLGRNILWNLGSFLWLSVLLILVTPYMARRLGLDAFGAWAVIAAVTGYLAAFDLGVGNAVIRFVAAEHERGNRDGVSAFVRTGFTLQLVLGLAAAAALFALSAPLAGRWLQVPAVLAGEALDSIRLAAAGVPLAFLSVLFAAVPAAVRRFDILAVRTVVLMSLQSLLLVGVLYLGGGLFDAVAVGVAGSAAILAYLVLAARALLPGVAIRPGWDGGAARELLRFGRGKFPAQVGVTLLQQLDRVAVGSLLSVGQVAFYAVPLRVAQRLGTVAEQIASPFYPAVTSHLTGARIEALVREYRAGVRIVSIVAFGAIAVLGALAEPILRVWMGPEFAVAGAWPFRILLFAYAAAVLFTLPSVAADAAARPDLNGIPLAAGSVLHMFLLWWWIPRFGLVGAASAVLVGFAVPLLFGVRAIHRAVPALPPVRTLFIEARGPLLAGAVTGFAASGLAGTRLPGSGAAPLLATLLLASLVYLTLLFAFGGLRVEEVRRFARSVGGGAEATGS